MVGLTNPGNWGEGRFGGVPGLAHTLDELFRAEGKSQDEDLLGGGVDAELFDVDAAVAAAVEDALAARTALT